MCPEPGTLCCRLSEPWGTTPGTPYPLKQATPFTTYSPRNNFSLIFELDSFQTGPTVTPSHRKLKHDNHMTNLFVRLFHFVRGSIERARLYLNAMRSRRELAKYREKKLLSLKQGLSTMKRQNAHTRSCIQGYLAKKAMVDAGKGRNTMAGIPNLTITN